MTITKLIKGTTVYKKLFSVLLFAITIVLLSFFQKFIRAQAAPGASLYFTGGSTVNAPGANLSLMMDSGSNQIGFARIEFSFDPTHIQLGSEIVNTSPLTTLISQTTMADANLTGDVVLIYALAPDDRANPPSGVFEIAQANFVPVTSTENVQTQIVFLTSTAQIVSLTGEEISVAGDPTNLVVNFTEVPTPTLTPTVTIEPTPTDTPTPTQTPTPSSDAQLVLNMQNPGIVNAQFGVDLSLATSVPVVGVDAVFTFDPTKVEVVSIADNGLLAGNTITSFDNPTGIVRISQVEAQGTSYVGTGSVATINFLAKAVGNSSMTFVFTQGSKSESNVISAGTGADILVAPAVLNFEIIDVATLTIQLKSSSEAATGDVVSGTLTVGNSNFSSNFTTDADGLSGVIELPASLIGSSHDFFIKTPGYLMRKATLAVVSGENMLDFGTIFAGDLNDDGIINNIDLALMYDRWFGNGPADYNKDGVTNTFDYWLLIQNFFKTND